MNYPIDFQYLGICLEGFFYGIDIYSNHCLCPKLLKQSRRCPGPGLYSGIFVLYLQYNASTKNVNERSKILFYALCLLYILSVAIFALDFIIVWNAEVSKNENLVQLGVNQ